MTNPETDSALFIDGVDKEVPIERLLPGGDCRRLVAMIEALLHTEVRLLGLEGEVLAGQLSVEPGQRHALTSEFEPVAFVECADAAAPLAELVPLLDWWLEKQLKYFMASSVHHAVVESDFRELQQRHRELAASEAKYRELADALEVKVAEQVETIKVAERKLYQQEKLASVGQLAAGVAHEINNPVGFVTSNLRMAGEYVQQLKGYSSALEARLPGVAPDDQQEIRYLYDDFAELLGESIEGCERVARIVANLKDFSNVDGCDKARESINTIVERVCALHGSLLLENVALELNLGEVPPLPLEVGHMAQVLSNLLANAAAALDGKVEGRVSLSTVLQDGYVVLRIADNGCGMDGETQRRAFDPFFTTRDVGQGVGLGLSVCRDIVLAHRGTIELDSESGRGTAVTIVLPVTEAE